MYIKNNIFEVEALPHGSLTPGGKANGGGRKGGKAKGVVATVTLQMPQPPWPNNDVHTLMKFH